VQVTRLPHDLTARLRDSKQGILVVYFTANWSQYRRIASRNKQQSLFPEVRKTDQLDMLKGYIATIQILLCKGKTSSIRDLKNRLIVVKIEGLVIPDFVPDIHMTPEDLMTMEKDGVPY